MLSVEWCYFILFASEHIHVRRDAVSLWADPIFGRIFILVLNFSGAN